MSQAPLRPLTISPPRSLLSLSSISASQSPLSSLQTQVDGLVGSFTQQATDWKSLAAMMAGGMTYRLGRVGAMAAGTGRIASVGIGLSAEVTAFEMSHRSLSSLTGDTQSNPNLWRWEGQGGIRQGLLNSLVTFGTLKGAGRLAQGENIFVQHLLQDTGMVLGHQVSGAFGITDRPQGTLAEQFLHAEATNLQLGAGMALAHSVAPGIQGLERGLDLSLRSGDVGVRFSRPSEDITALQGQAAFATAGSPSSEEGRSEQGRNPFILAMASASDRPLAAEPLSEEQDAPGRKLSGIRPLSLERTFPHVRLDDYQARVVALVKRAFPRAELRPFLQQEMGTQNPSLEEAVQDPRMRGKLLAEAANRALAQNRFPKTHDQWLAIHGLIELAYAHLDLETLLSYRDHLSENWKERYREALLQALEDGGSSPDVGTSLEELPLDLPGRFVIPRRDKMRDEMITQMLKGETSTRGSQALLQNPEFLGRAFAAMFINHTTPLIMGLSFLRTISPEGWTELLDRSRTDLDEKALFYRNIILEILEGLPELVRILSEGRGEFHRAFLESALQNTGYNKMAITYEELREIIDQFPEDLRRKLGLDPLPPLREL